MGKDLINLRNIFNQKLTLENSHKYSENKYLISGLDQVLLKMSQNFSEAENMARKTFN